jgi:hypothetical protein
VPVTIMEQMLDELKRERMPATQEKEQSGAIVVCATNDLVAPNGSHGSSGFALLRRGQSVRRPE